MFNGFDAEQVARMIFLESTQDCSIQMCLPGVPGARELFFLLFDLFIRGLLLMFGAENGDSTGIAVHTITEEQFNVIRQKMMVAGVLCNRITVDDPSIEVASTNILQLATMPQNLQLEDYRFEVKTSGVMHRLWFSLYHHVMPIDRICGMLETHTWKK